MVLVGVACVLAALSAPSPANAHTGFESSIPGDGDVVAEPVGEVTIAFTGPAIPVGEKFVALDPMGELRTPTDTTTDGSTFVLTFDPPLAGGQVGVRWSVQAPDTHPIEGSFAFTVSAPAPTSTVPAAAEPEIVAIDDGETPAAAETAADSPPIVANDQPVPAEPAVESTPIADPEPATADPAPAGSGPTLAEFLSTDDSQPASTSHSSGGSSA